MKKNLSIAIPIELIATGWISFILNKNDMGLYALTGIFGIALVVGTIAYFSLYEKLQKFSKAVIENTFHQSRFNQMVFKRHPEMIDEYNKTLENIKNYRPYSKEEYDHLFVFDSKNPHKQQLLSGLKKKE